MSGFDQSRPWPRQNRQLLDASYSGLLDRAAAIDPFLEATEIPHIFIAKILKGLAGECRSSAGGTVHKHRLISVERFVMVRRLRIGAELEHPARDVCRPLDLAGALQLEAIAYVDHKDIAIFDQSGGNFRCDLRD